MTLHPSTIHLDFPNGLPAFETQTRFRLIDREPVLFLESETTAGLSFLLLPVALIAPDYKLAMSAEDRDAIGASGDSRLMCLAVVTAAEDSPPTANLLAPLVINLDNGRAVQAVRSDSMYSHKKAICS